MTDADENAALPVLRRDGPNVTMTRYMLIAQWAIDFLHQFEDEIPSYHDADNVSAFIRRKAGVPRELGRETVVMLKAYKELEIVRQFDGGAMFDNLEYVDAFGPVKQLLGVVYRRMSVVLQWKEAQLASSGQKVVKIVDAMQLDSDNVTLADIHQQLKRARRRKRRKKKSEP